MDTAANEYANIRLGRYDTDVTVEVANGLNLSGKLKKQEIIVLRCYNQSIA